MKQGMVGALVAACWLACPSAGAQDASARTHDGFHLSVGVGAAYATTSVSLDPEPTNTQDTSISGLAVAGQLLIGGTPAPGLAIGGGSMGFHVFSPKVKIGDDEQDSDGAMAGNLLGVYADYYFDPQGGLHALALLGVATLSDGEDDNDLAVGFGGALGIGHDWWVSDQISVGALARLQFLSTSASVGDTDVDASYTSLVPALLATVTYH